MQIARITRAFPPRRDGISNHSYLLSKYQARLGHKVVVFQPHSAGRAECGFDIVNVNLGPLREHYGSKLVTGVFTARALLKIIRNTGTTYDILHVHGDVVEIAIALVAARHLKLPLVVTAHSRLNSSRHYTFIARKLWKQVSGAIVVSPQIAFQLEAFGVDKRKIAVITSGVETSRFLKTAIEQRQEARRRLGLTDGEIAILSVGRLTEMKGYEYLIRAVHRLPHSGHQRIAVLVAGEGPLRDSLESLANGDARIRFVGGMAHEKIPELLGASDMFVLPSVDRPGEAEGTPTAVMEAMACGLPVITTDSGGAQYVIDNRVGVTVVPQRDPDRLAQAMSALVSNSELRQELGAANRLHATEHDWSLISRRVTEFYRSLQGIS